ncbi:PAAR domain-containing protein [Streptomyces sp. UC4497]
MGQPAAKKDDKVTATDTHMIQPPGTAPPVPTPHPFSGTLDGGLSGDVTIMGSPAAVKGSTATNSPAHLPIGGTFVKTPADKAKVTGGSGTVKINGKPAVRNSDTAETCNDPKDLPAGTVVATGTVMIGG